MSIESLAIALHHSRATGTAKLVLIGIANHDGDGGSWPAVATLAKYAGVTERNVQKAIDRLVQLGEVRRIIQQGGDHSTADTRRPNLYRVLLECPHDCDRTSHHRTRRDASISTDLFELSTGVSIATPGVGSDRGRGVGSDTQTIPLTNHLSLVPNATTDARAETASERYERLIHEKCPGHRNGPHDFRWDRCGWCGREKPTLSEVIS